MMTCEGGTDVCVVGCTCKVGARGVHMQGGCTCEADRGERKPHWDEWMWFGTRPMAKLMHMLRLGCGCCRQSMPVGSSAVTSGCRSSTAHQAEATVPQSGYAVDSRCHRSDDHLQSAPGHQGTGQSAARATFLGQHLGRCTLKADCSIRPHCIACITPACTPCASAPSPARQTPCACPSPS